MSMTNDVTTERISQQLQNLLGPQIMALLNSDEVHEVQVNGDGCVWVIGLTGKYMADFTMEESKRKAFLGGIASNSSPPKELNSEKPIIDGILPWDGSRIAGCIWPVGEEGTSFNIRKKATRVFTLDEYERQGRITPQDKEFIISALKKRYNMLIAGPTGSGKTTFANAILHALSIISPNERLCVMEDVPELQVVHKDRLRLQKTPNDSLGDLVQHAMRRSPNRIIIGEVRDGSALDLLKSWNMKTRNTIYFCYRNSS